MLRFEKCTWCFWLWPSVHFIPDPGCLSRPPGCSHHMTQCTTWWQHLAEGMIVKTKLVLVLSGSLHGLLLLHTELHVEPLQANTTQVLQPQYWIQRTGTWYHHYGNSVIQHHTTRLFSLCSVFQQNQHSCKHHCAALRVSESFPIRTRSRCPWFGPTARLINNNH